MSFRNSDLARPNFLWDFLAVLFAAFNAKLKRLFDISQAFLIGLALGTGFWNQRTASYVKSVRRLPDYDSVLHPSPPQA